MCIYQTEKQRKYYDQVIEIYKRTGYSAYRIAKLNLVPVVRRTIEIWIANFVAENGKVTPQTVMEYNKESHDEKRSKEKCNKELEELQKKVADLETQLNYQMMRAEAYDTMINIAEKKFNIAIRKKSGAKQ